MKYHTDPNHPNVHDSANGTSCFWSESHPTQIEIITWIGYSPNTGEFHATKARFAIDKENKTITLVYMSIQRKYSSWNDTLTNPQAWLSDRMKRTIRDFISRETGSQYWRVK